LLSAFLEDRQVDHPAAGVIPATARRIDGHAFAPSEGTGRADRLLLCLLFPLEVRAEQGVRLCIHLRVGAVFNGNTLPAEELDDGGNTQVEFPGNFVQSDRFAFVSHGRVWGNGKVAGIRQFNASGKFFFQDFHHFADGLDFEVRSAGEFLFV
jgi:hypothetical protein